MNEPLNVVLENAISDCTKTIVEAEAKLRAAMCECLSRRADIVMIPPVVKASTLCQMLLACAEIETATLYRR